MHGWPFFAQKSDSNSLHPLALLRAGLRQRKDFFGLNGTAEVRAMIQTCCLRASLRAKGKFPLRLGTPVPATDYGVPSGVQ